MPGRKDLALELWPCSVTGCIGWEQPRVSMALMWGHDGSEGVGAAGSMLRCSLAMEVWAAHLQPCPTSHGLLLEIIPKHINPFQYTQTKYILHSTWPNTRKTVQAHLSTTSDEWNYDRVEIRVQRQWCSLVEVKLTTFANHLSRQTHCRSPDLGIRRSPCRWRPKNLGFFSLT